jgi:hypothetical protein
VHSGHFPREKLNFNTIVFSFGCQIANKYFIVGVHTSCMHLHIILVMMINGLQSHTINIGYRTIYLILNCSEYCFAIRIIYNFTDHIMYGVIHKGYPQKTKMGFVQCKDMLNFRACYWATLCGLRESGRLRRAKF